MAEVRNYTIGKNRIKKASLLGVRQKEDKIILEKGQNHVIFFPAVNSYEEGSMWGILKTQITLEDNCIYVIRAFAMDVEEEQKDEIIRINDFLTSDSQEPEDKIEFFETADCAKVVNCQNLLLYDLKGQYLWFCIQVIGEGNGEISHICLENPGDNFMQTFPEIYQERGSFFHRYMSIFSSLYGEMQEKIQNVENLLDFDSAPEPLLHLYAKWLGLQLEGDFLEEATLRDLLKEIYQLNRIKGTKEAISRLIQLLLHEEAVIVERNLIAEIDVKEQRELYDRLYGESKYDITILINRTSDEKLQAQLLYLLKQFKPIRSRIRLVFYRECNKMDSYCYLNRNAVLSQVTKGKTDGNFVLDGSVVLE